MSRACSDCGADISFRGSRATCCVSCAEVHHRRQTNLRAKAAREKKSLGDHEQQQVAKIQRRVQGTAWREQAEQLLIQRRRKLYPQDFA